jgi:sRNA-binding protein
MTETKLIGRLAMMRPILTLKNPVVQAKPRVAQDHPNNPEEEQREEQAQEADNKASTAGAPPPPLMIKLCEQFPKLFNLKLRKPLKVGIEEDILQALAGDALVTTQGLYESLCYYINSAAYAKGLKTNDQRFDLNGEVCGLVRHVYSFEAHHQQPKPPIPTPPLVLKLCERFPKTFRITDRKPIKVGIHKDILAIMTGEGILSAFALRQALQWYTRGINYHLAILEQTHRLDLKGNAVEEITPAQKARAALAIETIQSLRKKKRFVFKPKKQG